MTATFGMRLQNIIEDGTDGDCIDIFQVADGMGVSLERSFEDSTIIAELKYPDDLSGPTIHVNKKNTPGETRTSIALLLAKYCLDWGNGTLKESRVDIFYLREIRAYKTSRQVILATRLAIPDSIIEKANDLRFNSSKYAKDAKLLTNFVDSSIHIPAGSGLLTLLDSFDFSTRVAPLPKMKGFKNATSAY